MKQCWYLASLTMGLLATAIMAAANASESTGGIHKIAHVIVIMQENRSFDHYFGTFPGADGIQMQNAIPSVCVPRPQSVDSESRILRAINAMRSFIYQVCDRPFIDHRDRIDGAPHFAEDAKQVINNGRMDGFERVAAAWSRTCRQATDRDCQEGYVRGLNPSRVMGYHVESDIPNYWAYARNFVLQDHMFESIASWSLPSHLYIVSGWSADCSNQKDPMSCKSDIVRKRPDRDLETPFAWTELTYLLKRHGVSWGYYLDGGPQHFRPTHNGVPRIWNALPWFTDVYEDQQVENVQPLRNFLTAAQTGHLPAVSWIVPARKDSEHPPERVSTGQRYVTHLINAVMRSPDWDSTAIFLAWDDWGGFYDHVLPPSVDELGYGLRVPGLVVVESLIFGAYCARLVGRVEERLREIGEYNQDS
jgi:phospholipase C